MPALTHAHRAPLLCAMLAAASLVGACGGGGDNSAPNETFPNAAGVWHIVGTVDRDEESRVDGTVTVTQASLTDGTLGGSGTVTGTFLAGLVVTVTDGALGAQISPTGEITLSLSDASGAWSFNGRLSGNSIRNGRYLLRIPDGGEIAGPWSGSRTN